MEDPFYPSFWSPARLRRPAAPPATAKPSRSAKVVSIPVRFVGSDEAAHPQPPAAAAAAGSGSTAGMTRSAATLRIQKAFRGFLVRKNVRSVRRLEAEMDAIEREVTEGEERLRGDGRERLRVSEALMSVLLRLDSVRGVRELRRRAIRRAIALQEAVDAIVAVKEADEGSKASEGTAADEAPGAQEPMEIIQQSVETLQETLDDGDQGSSASGDADGEMNFEEKDSNGDIAVEQSTIADTMEETPAAPSTNSSPEEETPDKDMITDNGTGAGDDPEDLKKYQSTADDVKAPASLIEDEGSADAKTGVQSSVTGEVLPSPNTSVTSVNLVEGGGGQGCGESSMRQVMERVAEENRDLKERVAELCQRTELQCRLMSGLLQRVENLEAVVERRGRKKKRQATEAKKACPRRCDRKL